MKNKAQYLTPSTRSPRFTGGDVQDNVRVDALAKYSPTLKTSLQGFYVAACTGSTSAVQAFAMTIPAKDLAYITLLKNYNALQQKIKNGGLIPQGDLNVMAYQLDYLSTKKNATGDNVTPSAAAASKTILQELFGGSSANISVDQNGNINSLGVHTATMDIQSRDQTYKNMLHDIAIGAGVFLLLFVIITAISGK